MNRRRWWRVARLVVSLATVGAVVYVLMGRVNEIHDALQLLRRLDWRWVGLAVVFEAASMVVFARIQWRLLRAGGVQIPQRTMVEITLAGNAVAATLPGGVAWAAAWVFGQLKSRGVDRFLRTWVFLVAGAVSSFALFVVVAAGVWLAGSRGPVADLRWGVLALAAVPLLALVAFLLRSAPPVRRLEARLRRSVVRLPGGGAVVRAVRVLVVRIEKVRLPAGEWAGVLGLALLNWLDDCAVLIVSMAALGIAVPWRGIFVVYGVTQIAAALPFTPGGFGVVEGGLAALLHAYGVATGAAFATVVVYRMISFWGLVPVGWTTWFVLDRRRRAEEQAGETTGGPRRGDGGGQRARRRVWPAARGRALDAHGARQQDTVAPARAGVSRTGASRMRGRP